jgi:hypothetical protein
MKRIIFIISIFLLLSKLIIAQKKENDLSDRGLNGKVKSIVQRSEHFTKKRFWDSTMYIFNKKGDIITEYNYGRVRGLDIVWQYKYDKKRNLILKTCLDSSGTTQYKTIDEYDKNHHLIKSIWYDFDEKPGGLDSFKYDNKGNKIEAITYNADSSIKNKSVFKYNIDNRKVEDSYYEAGIFKWKTKYVYDEKGNIIEEYWLGKSDSLLRKLANKYNDKTLKIEQDWHNPDGNVYKTIYQYGTSGSLIREDWYNDNGKLSTTTRYKYEVDRKNNWIRITTLTAEGNPTRIIEREIEYF